MASLNWYFVALFFIWGLILIPMPIRLIKGRISTLSSINRGSPTCPHARHLWIHQNHDWHRNTIRDGGSICAFNNTRSFSSLTFDLRTPLLQGEVVFPKPLQALPSPCTRWWLFTAKWIGRCLRLPRLWSLTHLVLGEHTQLVLPHFFRCSRFDLRCCKCVPEIANFIMLNMSGLQLCVKGSQKKWLIELTENSFDSFKLLLRVMHNVYCHQSFESYQT